MRRDNDRDTEFRDLFVMAGPSLRRTAVMVVGDWHVAEDMTQQAMAKVYVAWPRIRAETRVAFARKVVVNECLSYLRRQKPEVVGLGHHLDVGVEPVGPGSVDMPRLLGLLPPRQRAVVALRFLDDLSVTETARVLGVSEGTVKSQTSKALAVLRDAAPDPRPHQTEEAQP